MQDLLYNIALCKVCPVLLYCTVASRLRHPLGGQRKELIAGQSSKIITLAAYAQPGKWGKEARHVSLPKRYRKNAYKIYVCTHIV